MKLGIPKEIKNSENRVAVTPAGVEALTKAGHEVFIEAGAGMGSGFNNASYERAGASMLQTAEEVWTQADMVMKVKEPLPAEYRFFRPGLVLFTYLHLAAEPELAKALMAHKVTGIAYETIEVNHTLPLLTPMSEIAGRMASQIGAHFLEKAQFGKGILLSGVPGVKKGKVTIIGGGIVGTSAAKIALGLGADVTVIDLNPDRLRQLEDLFDGKIHTLISNSKNIADSVAEADLLIGAVLIPGAKAPMLVTDDMVRQMEAGSVIIDVAVDQGGIVETIDRVTTHDNPVYEKHGVIHYAVANMPGAVPRTSTIALTNATLPYALLIAKKGLKDSILGSHALQLGLNTFDGHMTNEAVARDLSLHYTPFQQVI